MQATESRRTGRPPRRARGPQVEQSRFHSDLVKAKREGREVILSLAVETDYTHGDDCSCRATVEWVEPKSVLFTINGKSIWIMRAFIVSVELCHE